MTSSLSQRSSSRQGVRVSDVTREFFAQFLDRGPLAPPDHWQLIENQRHAQRGKERVHKRWRVRILPMAGVANKDRLLSMWGEGCPLDNRPD